MAKNIFLDYDGACAKVKKARDYKAQHDQVITDLKTLINGMTEVWTGNAQEKMAQEFASFEPTFKNFSQMLEDYADEMQAWANAFIDLDNK